MDRAYDVITGIGLPGAHTSQKYAGRRRHLLFSKATSNLCNCPTTISSKSSSQPPDFKAVSSHLIPLLLVLFFFRHFFLPIPPSLALSHLHIHSNSFSYSSPPCCYQRSLDLARPAASCRGPAASCRGPAASCRGPAAASVTMYSSRDLLLRTVEAAATTAP